MKTCKGCGVELVRRPKDNDVQWFKRKFCTMACAQQSQKAWSKR